MIVAIAMSGVALGTAVLIVTLSILAGFEKTLTTNVVGFTSHAEISSIGNRPLPDYPNTMRFIRSKVPEITSITPYVQREAVLRSSYGVAGILLRGVPLEDTTLIARKLIVTGRDLAYPVDSLPPILISKGLAEELNTGVGKSLAAVLVHEGMTSREDWLAGLKMFRVCGVYQTGMSEYDNVRVYTTLEAAQDFNGYSPKQVSGYTVMAPSLDRAPEVAIALNKVLRYPYFTESVYDTYQVIFAWIDLQKKPIPIILGLIIIVATFNIISTLLLIVIEKTHSIGILKALGATGKGVAQIFVTEGVAIGIIGLVAGNIIAFAVSAFESHYHLFKLKSEIYFMSSVPISIEWEHYAIVSAIALLLSFSATLIPARIASRLRPLEAMNYG